MGGGPPCFPQGSTCPAVLRILPPTSRFRLRGSHPLRQALPKPFGYRSVWIMQSSTPPRSRGGLGSSYFARRYFRNRCFFLFLALLRCFSSGGSPPYVMDSRMDDMDLPCRVSPFGYLRIDGYLLLPEAFRSLSRPSSAPGAKASALCPFCLTSPTSGTSVCPRWFSFSFVSSRKSSLLRSSFRSGSIGCSF